jgi:hypothetical protein
MEDVCSIVFQWYRAHRSNPFHWTAIPHAHSAVSVGQHDKLFYSDHIT